MDACPHDAIFKEDKYGAVLIDQERCEGERDCWEACPYGSIVFASDKSGEKAHKCTMCIDRLEDGQMPICVLSCSLRALDFGPLEELWKKYGDLDTLEECRMEAPRDRRLSSSLAMARSNSSLGTGTRPWSYGSSGNLMLRRTSHLPSPIKEPWSTLPLGSWAGTTWS